MTEWHLPPDYIVTHWTQELLELMIEKLTERKRKVAESLSKPGLKNNEGSDQMLFSTDSNLISYRKE